ncbi:MAG: hypothetical protein ACLGIN_16685 [Candidatus Sericytochromatia bacterium]
MEAGTGIPQLAQTVRLAGSAALKAAEVAGAGYRVLSEGYTRMIGAVMDMGGLIKIKGKAIRPSEALRKLEEWRQLAKHHVTGNPILDEPRRWFISNFGAPPEVIRIADEADRAARRHARPMQKQALALLRLLDESQQADLEMAVTEPPIRQKMITKLATSTGLKRDEVGMLVNTILDESKRMTALLREAGAVSEQGAARWEGQYLPRSYVKHMPTLAAFARKSSAIKGKKGRGIEKTVAKSSIPELQAQGWEFRGEVGNKARMWRDYTFEERVAMGQQFHAAKAMGLMSKEFQRDFKNGKMLAEIAKGSDDRGDFAFDAGKGADKEIVVDGSKYILMSNDNADGGVKRWGALAGKHVREDVKHYLDWASSNSEMLGHIAFVKKWTGTDLWKRFKTIWSPTHYLNNFMHNVPTLELAGGSAGDLPAAFREMASQGALFQRLEEFGTIKNGAIAHELGLALRDRPFNFSNPLETLNSVVGVAQNIEAGLGSFAQATDDLFRLALVQSKMREGVFFEDAARYAERTFYNSQNIKAPAAQILEAVPGIGVPFARVLWYSADKLPELYLTNPAKAIAINSYALAAKAIVDSINGTSEDEARARDEAIPPWMKQTAGTGYLPFPGKDMNGNPRVLNVANWNQFNVIDHAEQTDFPYYPTSLLPGGPVNILGQAIAGRDTFKDKDLRTAAGDETGRFLFENLAPGIMTRGGRVWDAAMGRKDYNGNQTDVPTAALGMFGMKVQPYNLEQGMRGMVYDFERDKAEIMKKVRRLAHDAEMNPRDAASKNAEIQRLIADLERRAADLSRRLEVAGRGVSP